MQTPEIITFKNQNKFFKALFDYDGSSEFEIIKEKEYDFDSEKGSCEVDVILKRLSDNKKFSASYHAGAQGNNHTDDLTFVEHITKQRKKKSPWIPLNKGSIPKEGNLLLLYDNNEIRRYEEEDQPIAIITHYMPIPTLCN